MLNHGADNLFNQVGCRTLKQDLPPQCTGYSARATWLRGSRVLQQSEYPAGRHLFCNGRKIETVLLQHGAGFQVCSKHKNALLLSSKAPSSSKRAQVQAPVQTGCGSKKWHYRIPREPFTLEERHFACHSRRTTSTFRMTEPFIPIFFLRMYGTTGLSHQTQIRAYQIDQATLAQGCW